MLSWALKDTYHAAGLATCIKYSASRKKCSYIWRLSPFFPLQTWSSLHLSMQLDIAESIEKALNFNCLQIYPQEIKLQKWPTYFRMPRLHIPKVHYDCKLFYHYFRNIQFTNLRHRYYLILIVQPLYQNKFDKWKCEEKCKDRTYISVIRTTLLYLILYLH